MPHSPAFSIFNSSYQYCTWSGNPPQKWAASFLISSAIIGVVAQRLARKVCEYCKYPVELDGDAALDLWRQEGSCCGL